MIDQFVLGIYDSSDRITSALAEGFCRNLMEFWIIEYESSGLKRVVTDTSVDGVLKKAAATDAKWLIFASLGCYFEDQTPFLGSLLETLRTDDSPFLLGHVLDRGDAWYELHDQCFVLNLEAYRELGCPQYGEPRRGPFEMMKPERSEENFHDSYTPKWVRPSSSFAMYKRLESGHGLLAAAWKAGLEVRPFDARLRAAKYFFYPTVRDAFARKYAFWERRQQMLNRIFFGFNTEGVRAPDVGVRVPPLRRLYSVASGLLFFQLLKKYGYRSGCRITFFDTSATGLYLMRRIVENWDGRNYPEFLRAQCDERTKILNFSDADAKWQSFVSDFGGEDQWLEFYRQVKEQCHIQFVPANAFDEGFAHQPWLDPGDPEDRESGRLLWLSNIFHFRYTAAMRSLEERFQIQNSLLQELARRDPFLLVSMFLATGRASRYKGIFAAGDYQVGGHEVPRFWSSRPARYPLVVRHFFTRHRDRRGPVQPVPERFRSLTVDRVPLVSDAILIEFAEWIARSSEIPSLRLDLTPPVAAMLAEARSCRDLFVAHRKDLNPGWESLCLHGLSAQQTEDFYRYGLKDRSEAQAKYRWTEIADRCPVTVAWLRDFFPHEHFDRVRFMLLKPGGFIQPHNDMDGVRGLNATNIALNQPEDCEMVFEKYGTVPWRAGDVRRLDIGLNHSVFNGSQEDRYHMIVHGRIGQQYVNWCRLTVVSFLKGEYGN